MIHILAYNVYIDNDKKVYHILATTEDEAIECAIKLYKDDYNKDISIEDCKIVLDNDDEE